MRNKSIWADSRLVVNFCERRIAAAIALLQHLGQLAQCGSDRACVRRFTRQGHRGVIARTRFEFGCLNRYRLRLSKAFRWRPHGPVMEYFRDHAMVDYFSGGFGGPGEGLSLVHGSISKGVASTFLDRMQSVAQDFAQQHLADQKLPKKDRQGYTLLLAMRSWEFEAFAAFRR